MITEDYVSYEVAKLLKEKGFDVPCLAHWFIGTNRKFNISTTPQNWNEINLYHSNELKTDLDWLSCPTLQMAMRWLREKFNINPVPYALSLGWAFDVFDLSNRDITGCKKLFSMDLPSKSKCYKSYEEACEAAIKYYLENFV